MTVQFAGAVSRLWRYAVKSMLGEELERAEVVGSGFFGNRGFALLDVESSRLVSAKNPAKWGRMFECSARLVERGNAEPPHVEITLADGRRIGFHDGDFGHAEEALSELLRRKVRLISARRELAPLTIEQYHPDIEEDDARGKTTEFDRSPEAQTGTFTDLAAVHLVTTASLEALSALSPSKFDPIRFRPDLLIDTGQAKGFVEAGWVGKTLAIGDEVRVKVFRECGRCVMTTLPQPELESDTGVLATIMRHNRGKLGVYASVVTGGLVRKGDRISLP